MVTDLGAAFVKVHGTGEAWIERMDRANDLEGLLRIVDRRADE
jgi:hypothetical protein